MSIETTEVKPQVSANLTLLAWVLILSGVVTAALILNELLGVYRGSANNSFIQRLVEKIGNSTLGTLGEFPVTITNQGTEVLAYFIFVPISLLGVHVAIALIRSGTHILSPTFPYQMARLKHKISNLNDDLKNK